MKEIIDPVDRHLLEQELTPDKYLRQTNNASNILYVVTARNSPNVMREIGRLRELAFRTAGGGTGKEVDIDELDTVEGGYQQMIVWDPMGKEIIGGYRFIISDDQHPRYFSTEHYFRFSDQFRKEYLPHTIELGRSFVQPKYQGRTGNMKGIYALDNLWDGLGALVVRNPDKKYFFGKVTMYGEYNSRARNLLLYFLTKYFPDHENLVEPIYPIEIDLHEQEMGGIFTEGNFQGDYKILLKKIREYNENIPPLINSYMNLSPSMKVFSTVRNPDFGDVEETGLLVTISDIYPQKAERHINNIE